MGLAARIDPYVEKQRVVVMTDIANEPDDQMSMVRFLVLSYERFFLKNCSTTGHDSCAAFRLAPPAPACENMNPWPAPS